MCEADSLIRGHSGLRGEFRPEYSTKVIPDVVAYGLKCP